MEPIKLPSLVWATPCYGDIDPQVLGSFLATTAKASKVFDVKYVATPDRQMIATARQAIVEASLEKGVDFIFWADSDMILPSGIVPRLASHKVPIVSGIYFQRHPPHWPLMLGKVPGKRYKKETCHNWVAQWPKGLIKVGAVGFGCILTATEVFRKMPSPWFKYDEKGGEDIQFCVDAQKYGYEILVDTEVLCGHLSNRLLIDEDMYLTCLKNDPTILKGKFVDVEAQGGKNA